MSRAKSSNDFTVQVDGLGLFTFARRVIRDTFRIRGSYVNLNGGFFDEDGNFADLSALAYATLSVLLVDQPDGFDVFSIDPLVDDGWEEKILKIFSALREKELSFRKVAEKDSQGSGEKAGEQPGSLVSREVQPGAN